MLTRLALRGFRGYDALDVTFGPGAQLVWGANAAGKTSLLEAIVLCARGSSHRAAGDTELIRWGEAVARVEARQVVAGTREMDLDVALARDGPAAGRKRIRVNGVPRRASVLPGVLRIVLFAPEEMQLVVGPPGPRRATLDALAAQRLPSYAAALTAYGRVLAQRNALLRAIREEQASRDQLPAWDARFLQAGAEVLDGRAALLAELAAPLAAAHGEIAPDEGRLALSYESNAAASADETPAAALARRLRETADKEVWNGATLVGPHRDDMTFRLDGRDMASFASRGQQRTAILALKLAELDLLTTLDGHPPLLLLDDVFSELDPARRAHLVRRIAGLPQAFVTTTSLDDLDPRLVAAGDAWEVLSGGNGTPDGTGASPGAGAARVVRMPGARDGRDEATRDESP